MKILFWGPAPFGSSDYSKFIGTLGPALAKHHEVAYFTYTHVQGLNGLAYEGSPVFSPPEEAEEEESGISARRPLIVDVVAQWKPDIVIQVFDIVKTWPEGIHYINFPLISYSPVFGLPLRREQADLLKVCVVNVPCCEFASKAYTEAKVPASQVIYPAINKDYYPEVDRALLRKQYGLEESFVVLIAGNDVSNLPAQIAAWLDFKHQTKANTKLVVISNHRTIEGMVAELLPREDINDFLLATANKASLSGFYHAADVLLHCPHADGFGLTVLEAGICGLPVIATRWGILEELLDDNSAWLIHGPRDYCPGPLYQFMPSPEMWLMTEALKEAYNNPEKRQRKAETLKERVLKRFEINVTIGDWLKILE
jgi:glycosyltransferase involved in cell wall biosynthesis